MNRLKLAALAVSVALIGLDQIIKDWAVRTLPKNPTVVISGLFNLTYVENRGAAFGILQNSTTLLLVISFMVLILLVGVLFSRRVRSPLAIWSIALILAGGFGNCIDRAARRFVVDYLDFSALFGFPVFNLADCCVVIGTALLLSFILFFENRIAKAESTVTEEDTVGEEN